MKHSSKQINDFASIDKNSLQAFNKQIKHLQQQYPRQFSLCLNLSCGINNSIDNPLQIPPEMLSKSIDILHANNNQLQIGSQQLYSGEMKVKEQKFEIKESEGKLSLQKIFVKEEQSERAMNEEEFQEKQEHREDLNLEQFVKTQKLNTKNVLRNFGNAQNQYILYSQDGKKLILELLEERNLLQFQEWVRNLKLLNFRDYRSVWGDNVKDTLKIKMFKNIYRKLCWQFYQVTCIPYIYSGRMSAVNRLTHLKQISSMLKGIQSPDDFNSFHD